MAVFQAVAQMERSRRKLMVTLGAGAGRERPRLPAGQRLLQANKMLFRNKGTLLGPTRNADR